MPNFTTKQNSDGSLSVMLDDGAEFASFEPSMFHLLLQPTPAEVQPEQSWEVQPDVYLEGRSIATVDVGNDLTKIVIFLPTRKTHKAVQDHLDADVNLHVVDRNGQFGPKNPQRIVDSVYEAGTDTMIVTTENQS